MIKLIYYILIAFPFVKWMGVGFSSDVQPLYLVAAGVVILFYGIRKKIRINQQLKNLYIFLMIGLFTGAIFTLINNGFTLEGVPRYIVTYVGLIINTLAAYLIIEKDGGIDENILKIAICVYLAVGLIQRLFLSDFMYVWISNARTSGIRGVISLTSEPSFYGYMCVFFMILSREFGKHKYLFLLLNLFQIIILANSSVTILYLGIYLVICVVLFIPKLDFKRIILLITIGVISLIGIYKWLSIYHANSRTFYFMNLVLDNNYRSLLYQLSSDGSVVSRYNDIMFCLEEFIHDIGMPHGFSAGKMSSGYGSMIYTMGWIGVLIIISVFNILRKTYVGEVYLRAIPIFLTIILFSSIQISVPLFGFILALSSYKHNIQ